MNKIIHAFTDRGEEIGNVSREIYYLLVALLTPQLRLDMTIVSLWGNCKLTVNYTANI